MLATHVQHLFAQLNSGSTKTTRVLLLLLTKHYQIIPYLFKDIHNLSWLGIEPRPCKTIAQEIIAEPMQKVGSLCMNLN